MSKFFNQMCIKELHKILSDINDYTLEEFDYIIPFTDIKHYSEQIYAVCNIIGITKDEAESLAEQLLKYHLEIS